MIDSKESSLPQTEVAPPAATQPKPAAKPPKKAVNKIPEKATESIDQTIARFHEIFPGVEKTRLNTFTNSRYASLDDIWNAAKPYMLQLNLRPIAWISENTLYVRIINEFRDDITSDVRLPDSMDNPQKFGSARTYYLRYLICTMLGIVETDDDDGNAGAKPAEAPSINEKQTSSIIDLIAATETDEAALSQYLDSTYNKSAIEELSYSEAAVVIKLLKSKLEKKADAA